MIRDASRLFKALGDETRLRILNLLCAEEVSVTEIAAILDLGQSRVSSQLAILRDALALRERREGRRALLSLDPADSATAELLALVRPQLEASRVCRLDLAGLERVVARRPDGEGYFDLTAGDLGRRHLPGRTWEGFARALLELVPRQRVADVGIGDADMTMLLATFSARLFAIDPDDAVLARAGRKIERSGASHVELLQGEIEALPLPDGSIDLLVASQVLHHAARPPAAVRECSRVLAPGGRLVVLDLKSHTHDWVRDKLEDRWLGFDEKDLSGWLEAAGLEETAVRPVARDRKPPRFVTLLATGRKRSKES